MRRGLEADLRAALAEGKLQMAYQPQVNDRTGLTGVEVLMRWHHPERGHISPAVFTPVAEDCGLIVELGMYALRVRRQQALEKPQSRGKYFGLSSYV